MNLAWKSAPLGEICAFSNGLWTGKKAPFEQAIVLRNTNFRSHGQLDYSDAAVLDVESKQLAKRRLQRGDILIEKSGGGPKQPVGRVAYFDKAEGLFSFSNFTSVARVLDQALVNPRYLVSFLDWCYVAGRTERMQSHSTGIRNLDFNAYKAIEVPLPLLEEQCRIVAVLDEAFAAIADATANAEKNLANARELFERMLHEVFTVKGLDWIEEPLHANTRFIDYRGKTPPKSNSGIRLITAKNVKMGYVQRVPEEFIESAAYESWMTRGIPSKGDVLFTTEAPLGNVAQLDTDEKVVIGQRLITMQPNPEKLDPAFLKYMLCSLPLQEAIHSRATGATVSGIKASLLKLVSIFYPCTLAEQHELVAKLDAAYELSEAMVSQYRSKIAELAALKKSLLHCAFTGELSTSSEIVSA